MSKNLLKRVYIKKRKEKVKGKRKEDREEKGREKVKEEMIVYLQMK